MGGYEYRLSALSWEFRLSRPRNSEKLKIRDSAPRRRARDRPGVASFAPAEGSGMPRPKRARETENLASLGRRVGSGARRSVGENPGCRGGGGAAEFQKSSFSKKRTLENLHWGSVVDPKQSFVQTVWMSQDDLKAGLMLSELISIRYERQPADKRLTTRKIQNAK